MPAAIIPISSEEADHVTHADFEQALGALLAASKLPSKQREIQVQPSVNAICGYAYENGLSNHALSTALDIVTQPNFLGQTSITTLIRGLYPASRVSADLVFNVVASLGSGRDKPSPPTQNLLLRWVIMIYEVLEDRHHYAICLQSSPEGKILELSRTIGNEPALIGLIRVYKDYYPDVIVGDAAVGRASHFNHPNSEWRERLHMIHASNLRKDKNSPEAVSFKVVRRGAKRTRVSLVPEVQTSRADGSSTTLEEVANVDDLVEKLDRIHLPNQMIAALDDPLLQKYIGLRPSIAVTKRMDRWLDMFLDEQLHAAEDGREANKALSEILGKILSYTRFTKTIPHSAKNFLVRYLIDWDGLENQSEILGLLAYLPIQSFEELQQSILNKLDSAIVNSNAEGSAMLLKFYTTLLRHWTSYLLSLPSSTAPTTSSPTPAFTALTAHASLLSLSLLASVPPTLATTSTVLSYHEALAHAISHAPKTPYIRIATPLAPTVYLLAFSNPSLSTLSRLCSILATYKRAFETAMGPRQGPGITGVAPHHEYPRDHVNDFNGFLMDICNLLWRSRAFNTTDTNAHGCLLATSIIPPLRAYAESVDNSLPTLFSLSQNSVLSALSIACFRDLEDAAEEREEGSVRVRHAGPVSQRSLAVLQAEGGLEVNWAAYRAEVLRWLDEMGVKGVGELMFCTMKLLMGGKVASV
ncbi:hypothetical protein MMC08_006952 [Hypocenomyce scalaris]|nr:hypothetical protein [Hypocenomyce scalaris]